MNPVIDITQLTIWRFQAFDRLERLISKMQGGANPNDGSVDNLIRVLSQQPPRPADKPPYLGIFAVSDVAIGRKKAVARLQELAGTVQGGLNSTDSLLDNLIRSLSSLPSRPADKPPYASLFPPSKMIWLTPQQIGSIAPEASPSRVATLTPFLNRTMVEYEINTPLRQAHFLAQIAHESDRFNALEEYASGSAYEWREDLGNVQSGDGVRFKGRGLIQVTGRTNYRKCGNDLGVDLIANPKRLAEPDLACRSAGWYWDTQKLNPDADRDDVLTITKVINGGTNGLGDRTQLLQMAKRVLRV